MILHTTCREMGDDREWSRSTCVEGLVDEGLSTPRHQRAGRSVYIEVNLDHIVHNVNLMKSCCKKPSVGLMCVVKADAYGHGAIPVARHLKSHGADRLAVATVAEGVQLRHASIPGPIHVLGNVQDWEMIVCARYQLIPTVACCTAIDGMALALGNYRSCGVDQQNGDDKTMEEVPVGTVHIKVDSGMSRNGCQPHQLPELVQRCKDLDVPLEGIFSHIADYEDPLFSKQQTEKFENCIQSCRKDDYVYHMSGSGAIIQGYGTQYDYIRPGISMFGVPGTVEHVEDFMAKGFRPALSIKGVPTLVKKCEKGRKVGYGCTYTCTEDEWIATFPIGYADGIWRCLAGRGHVVRDKTGERCPYVGRVSMDAITVRLPCQPDDSEVFSIVTADFDPVSSVMGIATLVDTIPNEVLVRLSTRLPRVYVTDSVPCLSVTPSLNVNLQSSNKNQQYFSQESLDDDCLSTKIDHARHVAVTTAETS